MKPKLHLKTRLQNNIAALRKWNYKNSVIHDLKFTSEIEKIHIIWENVVFAILEVLYSRQTL
jgi:hypothetical protein